MNTIAILPERGEEHPTTFHAITTGHKATGRTPGEALNALTSQLGADKTSAAVIVQPFRPDGHFSAEQRDRLSSLMARWRVARETGSSLPQVEQTDLERLVDDELKGATERAAQISRELKPAWELRRSYEDKEAELRSSWEKESRRASRLHTASMVLITFAMLLDVGICVLLIFLKEAINNGITGVVIAATLLGVMVLITQLFQWLSDAADKRVAEHRLAEERLQLAKLEILLDLIEHSADSGNQREQPVA